MPRPHAANTWNISAATAHDATNFEGIRMREVFLGSNHRSHNPTDQYFGLGSAAQIETLTVQWPDGSETLMQDVEPNQRMTIDHPRL